MRPMRFSLLKTGTIDHDQLLGLSHPTVTISV